MPRQVLEIDLEEVMKNIRDGISLYDMAKRYNCSERTLQNRIKTEYNFTFAQLKEKVLKTMKHIFGIYGLLVYKMVLRR